MTASQLTRNQQFEGIIVPLYLPLDERERIIANDLRKHVRYLLDRGVQGFLVPSGTGEFYNLGAEARRQAVETVVREVNGAALVVSLTGDCGTDNALEHIAAAREAGADAAMMTPPYYAPVSQAVLKQFFNDLANEGGLPLWLYHQPEHTKLTIAPETVAELADNPNIVGLKASGWVDLLYYYQVLRRLRDKPNFRLLMGEDMFGLSGLILGGHGMVATLANLLPAEFVGLWEAIQAEDLASARRLQDRIMDVQEGLMFAYEAAPAAAKLVLQKRGVFSSNRCTRPAARLSDAEHEQVVALGARLELF